MHSITDSKYMYNVTKDFRCSFKHSIHQRILENNNHDLSRTTVSTAF